MSMRFATNTHDSLPLYLLAPQDLAGWLATQSHAHQAWLVATGFDASLGDTRILPGTDGRPCAAVAGIGTATARLRLRFWSARIASSLPQGSFLLDQSALASPLVGPALDQVALGWLLAGYRFTRYAKAKPLAASLIAPEGVDSHRLEIMAAAEALTRDLINTPTSDMGPDALEAAFFELGHQFGATMTAIRGASLLEQNFPMIHAVGRAAAQAPRLLDLRWGKAGPKLTLVGKGVCFDTGGLDIKPASGMLLMKKDMGGAATVMGLAQMVMALNLPIQLRVLVPAVENAISANAFRPKDILTSRAGLTVEVNNTDAEGRLVLADALALAREENPNWLISMATLTGAARVALGPDLSPYFTDDPIVSAALERGAAHASDPVWRLPFWPAYEKDIEPGIADLDNAPSGGFAGAITAALFLRRFAGDDTRYTHFDIYGWSPADLPARPKGGVGMGARAILNALPDVLGI